VLPTADELPKRQTTACVGHPFARDSEGKPEEICREPSDLYTSIDFHNIPLTPIDTTTVQFKPTVKTNSLEVLLPQPIVIRVRAGFRYENFVVGDDCLGQCLPAFLLGYWSGDILM